MAASKLLAQLIKTAKSKGRQPNFGAVKTRLEKKVREGTATKEDKQLLKEIRQKDTAATKSQKVRQSQSSRKTPVSLAGSEKVGGTQKAGGGKMKSKGYAGGGKVKHEKALELKKKAGPKTTKNKKKKTKDNDLFGGLFLGGGYQRGTMPGDTFKAGGKIKSKGYKVGGKMSGKPRGVGAATRGFGKAMK